MDEKESVQMKVDVGVLKTQVASLTQLCDKMDKVIEKLMDNQDKNVNQIYSDMDKRKNDTIMDIKELHSRITTVYRNLSDKIELTELMIMKEIKSLRDHIEQHNKKEDGEIKKILEWKWMAAGGIVALAWLISNVNLDMISRMFK